LRNLRTASLVSFAALAMFAAFGVTVECGRAASPRDCRTMAEHYLDLAVQESAGNTVMSPSQRAAIRRVEDGIKHAEPTYRMVLERCAEVDRAAASCALQATTTAAWESCLRASGAR
jgi:hypothetical protein